MHFDVIALVWIAQSTSHIVTIVSIVYISRLHSEKCRAYASVTAAFDGTACIESFFLLF